MPHSYANPDCESHCYVPVTEEVWERRGREMTESPLDRYGN